jgi:cytochrome c-type biogenesis protein CcmH/NrfF
VNSNLRRKVKKLINEGKNKQEIKNTIEGDGINDITI